MHPGVEPDIGFRAGDLIAGKYRVDRVLGAGGMGVVLAARHLRLDELVAIKLLLPEALTDADAVRRFEREARAAVKIKSEHVARIIDVGTLDDGAPFIVMEYLEGEDLAERVTRTGPLAVEDAIELLLQACEAIAEAHALGIVHRDLKPANLFCVQGADGRPSLKVLDFGISKFTHVGPANSGLGMTKTKALMGSPFYMSPEQMESPRAVDARTDVWSLGVVLYQLLTGNVPFTGETLPQVCVNVATRPAPSLRKSRSDVPQGVEAVVMRCLEKDPNRRYPTVAALATALARFGPRRAQASLDRITRTWRHAATQFEDGAQSPPVRATDRPVTGPVPSWGGTAKSLESRRRNVIGWAVATFVVVALALSWSRREPAKGTLPETAVLVTPPSMEPANEGERRPIATNKETNGAPSAVTSAARNVGSEAEQAIPSNPSVPGSEHAIASNRPGSEAARAVTSNPVENALPTAPSPTMAQQETAHAPASPSRLAPAIAAADIPRLGAPAPRANADTDGNPYGPAPPTPKPAPETPKSAPHANMCTLNLNSIPAAMVVVDGVMLGFTPRIGVVVPAGDHTVLFRGPSGDKLRTVKCAPGESRTVAPSLDEPSSDELPVKNPYR